MRGSGLWRVGCAATAALGLIAASPAAAGAAEAPPASVEVVGATTPELQAKPLEVDFQAEKKEDRGRLRLPLVVRETGELEVSFVDLETGEPVVIGEATTEPVEKLEIAGRIPPGSLEKGRLFLLDLVFSPPSGKAKKLNGVLKVGIKGGLPVTRTVAAAAPEAALAIPAQKKVEVEVTSFWPWSSGGHETREVGIEGVAMPEEAQPKGAKAALAKRYLAVGKDGKATVTVGAPREVDGETRSRISVTGASGTGTASTVVNLGGGEGKESQQLEVALLVGDEIWFPLLIVFLGALIGKLLPTWWDTRRERKLLSGDLEDAIAAYEAEEPLSGTPPNHLKSLTADELKKIKQLKSQLSGVILPKTLEKQAEEAKEAADRLAGWVAVHKALRELGEAVRLAKPLLARAQHRAQRPLLDSLELLDRPLEIGPDLARSEGWATEIVLQAEALKLYASIHVAGSAGDADEEAKEIAKEGLDAYLAAAPPLGRAPGSAEALVEKLRQIHGWLYEPPSDKRIEAALAAAPGPVPESFASPGDLLGFVKQAVSLVWPHGGHSPEEVMSRVRRGDWAIFLVVLAISAIAYLVPVYTPAPFGSFIQYLGAFAAGAGLQVAITGAAVPWARSMKASGGEEGEKKDAAPAAA